MTIRTRYVDVGDTPTLIAKPEGGAALVYQAPMDPAPSCVFLGGADVTEDDGMPLWQAAFDGSDQFKYEPEEPTDLLYGVAPTGETIRVRVFEVGRA